jgi:hypothetical protein
MAYIRQAGAANSQPVADRRAVLRRLEPAGVDRAAPVPRLPARPAREGRVAPAAGPTESVIAEPVEIGG